MEGRICLIRVDSDRGDLLVESDVRVRGASLRRGPQASLCHASADHPDGTVGVFSGWRGVGEPAAGAMNDIIEFHAAPIPGRAIRPSSIPQQSFPCERGFPADFTTEAPQGDNFVRFPIDNVIRSNSFHNC